jgi:FkbM family methyltransferase
MTKALLDYLVAAGLQRSENGKILLPDWAKRVKIDVGLSYSAPNAVSWIREDSNLLVFGFEPLPESCTRLRQWLSEQPDSVSLLSQLVIVPVALGREAGSATLHITANDTASSSLLTPKNMGQQGTIEVQVFTIFNLLKALPKESVTHIDYLKLDCQGMDLEIVKGAGGELERIALVTAEAEDDQYHNSSNSLRELVKFMESKNFVHLNARSRVRVVLGQLLARLSIVRALRIRLPVKFSKEVSSAKLSVYVEDPTFVNRAFLDQVMSGTITGSQKG